jgi:hypothetical protein
MNDGGGSWFGFDDLFWLTLFVLFFAAFVGALLRRFRRNGCLKLFDNYHVTYINAQGKLLWGDLYVSSQGVELIYDSPFVTSRGLIKGSHLAASSEVRACLALCRTVHALTQEERKARLEQIRQTFSPRLLKRSVRKVRNYADMMRDAIANSLSMFVGAMSGRLGAAMASRQGDVNDLGKTLVGAVANAYEPLLERHIGKPVVVECRTAASAGEATTEFAGYLVEYTEEYLAVFSVDQGPRLHMETTITDTHQYDGFTATLQDNRVTFVCEGPDALIVRSVQSAERRVDLDVTLLPGCTLDVNVSPTTPSDLIDAIDATVELTHQLDLVCPRVNAQIRFSSDRGLPKENWHGVAPDAEVQT